METPEKKTAEASEKKLEETPEKKTVEASEKKLEETSEKKSKKNYLAGIVPVLFLALGIFLFFATENFREKQAGQKEKEQYQAILPEGAAFEKIKTDKQAVEAFLAKSGLEDIRLRQILLVKNKDQQNIGTIYELSDKSGYGGDLTLLIGMNESNVLCGIVLKEAPEIVTEITKKELNPFLEQFQYSRKDKVFWIDEQIFGGMEIVKMDSAPVTSREIVRMVNGCRQLADNLGRLTGGQKK